MNQGTDHLFSRVARTQEHHGAGGVVRKALNRLLVRGASLDIVHVLLLEPDRLRVPSADPCVEMRFLQPDEIGRFARNPSNGLAPEYADRAARGLDLCFGAIHGDRLASYGWYALHSVEAEHSAGASLGLPADMAYLYKAFTHPDFRGRRLNGACVGRAMSVLAQQGISRLLCLVYWSNAPSLRSFERLGCQRLGLLAVGPGGPTRVPSQARRLGVRFGQEAQVALQSRARVEPALPATA